MNITVVNASPKRENSITFHTVLYIDKHSNDTFTTFHITNKQSWEQAYFSLCQADIVIFSYPVYTFIAPSRLHEFVHFIKQKGGLEDKKYVQITTSKHFYDTTAHAWLNENCADLGMAYLGGLSADMEDLLTEKGQKEALDFWKMTAFRYENNIVVPTPKIESKPFVYQSLNDQSTELLYMKPDDQLPEKQEVENKVVVVASIEDGDNELVRMIADYAKNSTIPVEVFNVNTFPFKGSCISCFSCASTGKCIYVDNFDTYLRKRILTARALVYAFRVSDHSMGVQMKVYDDRQFCNGHRTVTMGMPIGFIVAGDLSGEENLRVLMKARADVGGNYMAGIAQQYGDIEVLAKTIDYALEQQLAMPRMFLGVGGMKIFRDLIWQTQGLMRADHRFFKEHGQYDFPQKRRTDMWKMYLVGALMNNPKVKQKAAKQIAEGMISPYKKILNK